MATAGFISAMIKHMLESVQMMRVPPSKLQLNGDSNSHCKNNFQTAQRFIEQATCVQAHKILTDVKHLLCWLVKGRRVNLSAVKRSLPCNEKAYLALIPMYLQVWHPVHRDLSSQGSGVWGLGFQGF